MGSHCKQIEICNLSISDLLTFLKTVRETAMHVKFIDAYGVVDSISQVVTD